MKHCVFHIFSWILKKIEAWGGKCLSKKTVEFGWTNDTQIPLNTLCQNDPHFGLSITTKTFLRLPQSPNHFVPMSNDNHLTNWHYRKFLLPLFLTIFSGKKIQPLNLCFAFGSVLHSPADLNVICFLCNVSWQETRHWTPRHQMFCKQNCCLLFQLIFSLNFFKFTETAIKNVAALSTV